MKHFKSTTICGYGGNEAPAVDELDDLRNFDDRTLVSLVGTNVAHPADDMADLCRSLDRWQDRGKPRWLA
jgi:hypothetical protein